MKATAAEVPMTLGEQLLKDALRQLSGWTGDTTGISRTLPIDDSQHAEMTERIKVYADTLELRPFVRRHDGATTVSVRNPDGVSANDIAFAARVEDAYRSIAHITDIEPARSTWSLAGWWKRRTTTT
ncbi:hypothetical protein Afil01_11100 [Actinorhabdospora filicis]|uniref:Uncharacterized protein n=1 Tax=Actinorhabdospora filicis TaxID=1785913 RepID=A0A9W6SHX1_9ACTN|nr:hypothetical protein Afil01_11100 [Actinorhabdospora filicis]